MATILIKNTFRTIQNLIHSFSNIMTKASLLLVFMLVWAQPALAIFDPILIDDDSHHFIWKITGANNFDDLLGKNLNDHIGTDIIKVGDYPQGYNLQDLARTNDGKVWALGMGLGKDGAQLGHAYIGEIVENAGKYTFENIVDLGYTYANPKSQNHGKALVWDPDNNYFIYEANATDKTPYKTTFKAFDPDLGSVLADPWGTGNAEMVVSLPHVEQFDTFAQGLAFSKNGDLYATIGNQPSLIVKLERDNNHKLTGNSTQVDVVVHVDGKEETFNNIEVLTFSSDDEMIIVDSNSHELNKLKGRVFKVNLATGRAREIADLDTDRLGDFMSRDWEGISFNTPVYRDTSFGCTTDSYLFMSYNGRNSDTVGSSVNITTGKSTPLKNGNAIHDTNINAIGFNLKDNNIWGYDRSREKVVKVDKNYKVTSYAINNLPNHAYHIGDVSPKGVLYLADQWKDRKSIYKINVDPSSPNYLKYTEKLTLKYSDGNPFHYFFKPPTRDNRYTITGGIADFAFHPGDGQIYLVSKNGTLYKINPDTGVVTEIGNVGINSVNSNAAWFDKDGYFYFNRNSTDIYRIDITDPDNVDKKATFFSNGSFPSEADAARCPMAAIPPSDTALTIHATIINDDGGNASIGNINLVTNAGSLAFNNVSSSNNNKTITYIADALDISSGNYNLEAGDLSGYSLGEWSCTHSKEFIATYHNPPQNTQVSINIAKGDNVVCSITYDDKPPEVNKCFAMTDNVAKLYKFDLDINTPPVVVNTTRTLNGEASTYRDSNNSVYIFNQDLAVQDENKPSDLYKVNVTNGAVSLVKKAFLPKKANGAEFIKYSDRTERFITIQNKNHSTLSIFDAADLTNALPIKTLALTFPDGTDAHVDGLAINPTTGEVLVSDDFNINDSTDHADIYSVNMKTGKLSLVTTLAIQGVDAEALAFAEDGNLYTENEWEAPNDTYKNKIFRVDLSTGNLVAVEDLTSLPGDIEGMSCTGSKVSTTVLPSFTKEASPTTTAAGSTVSFTYKINNTTSTTLVLDLQDDPGAVNDFTGTTVNESLTPVNGAFLPATLKLNGLLSNQATVNDNNVLTIEQLSIPPNLEAEITIDMRIPSSHAANDYFTQAVISNLNYQGNGSQNTNTSIYSDDPNRVGFPDPTLLTVTKGTDKGGCDVLTDNINAGLSPVSSLTNNDKIFLGSTDLSGKEGHLKAFNVDSTGALTGNALWDVYSLMNTTKRGTKLYATNASSQKSRFSGTSSSLTSKDDFTVADANAVTALTTRINNAKLGSLSPGSHLALITNEMDTLSYLNDPYYRSHYTTTIASRTKRILASSDDGFLYAFNQEDGELGWGWMPHSLLSELKNGSATFMSEHYMQGVIDVIDIKDSTTSYKSYVVGSYRQGLGHYVLRLSDDKHSNLDNIVWEQDLDGIKTSSPNNGKPGYFKDASGTAYIAYIASDSNSSTLYIKKVSDDSYPTTISLSSGIIITSTPYIMSALDGGNGKTIFIGDKDGNIYSTDLLDSNGALNSTSTITSGLNSAVSTLKLDPTDTAPVLFIGGARSSKNNDYYLRSQSANRLTVFRYNSGSWERQWTSATSTATRWMKDNNNTIVADTSDNNVTALQTSATITDNAYIVADSIVLPVMHAPDPNSNDCDGASYYYFYNLTDGHFPTNTFYSGTTAITAKLNLGVGKTRALHLTNLLGSDNMLGLGMSDQTDAHGTRGVGINASIITKDPFTTGIRSWRELRD